MIKKIEIFVFVSLASCLLLFAPSYEAKEEDGEQLDHFSRDFIDRISRNYLEKTERAQRLRNEMHDQLNLLSHLNTMSDHSSNDKLIFFSLLGKIRRVYLELDEILDGFVPTVKDAHEIITNFKTISESGANTEDLLELNSNELQTPTKPFRLAKRYDWFKRNMFNSNLYSKVPVIRTGK